MQQMIFIADFIACSTCFGHHYAHKKLPKTPTPSPHDTRHTLQQHIQRTTLNAKNTNYA